MSIDLEQPEVTLDSTAPTNEGASPSVFDDTNDEGLNQEIQQPDAEEVEEELEGVKLRGKKELLEKIKSERLMQADYTRKTQELAEQKRSDETARQQFQREQQEAQQFERDKFQFWSAAQRFQQLQQVNLSALRQQNPELAESLRDELTQLSAALPGMERTLAQKTAQRRSETERQSATRADEAEAIVMREVKDWGPEKLKKFVDAGEKAGLQPEKVRQLLIEFPQASRFINKALAYDQLLAQRLQKQAQAEPPQPVTRVGGASNANTKPLSEVTDPREWAERRRQWKSRNR